MRLEEQPPLSPHRLDMDNRLFDEAWGAFVRDGVYE
jgi:hypothetical protein